MILGLIKWFDDEKGFGAVGTPDKGEYFLHRNNFIEKPDKIEKGTALVFKMQNDFSKNRHNAVNCRPVTNRDDWSLILTYLTKSSDIVIEKIVKGQSRHGNPYTRKENTAISLKKAAARQLFRKKSIEETKEYIIDYFNKELSKSDFVPYCEFLEDRINKCISTENRTALLNDIFNYFGKNVSDEALFYTWKSKKFNYISWASNTDHVIPEDVLKKFSLHIHQPELQRIYIYPFGPSFCHSFFLTKLENLKSYTSEEIKSLYPLLAFLEEGVRDTFKKSIDLKYSERYSQETIEKAKKLGRIDKETDFDKYKWLKNTLPDNLDDENKSELKKIIDELIISNSSEEYKVDLWLKDILNEVSFERISERFFNDNKDVQTKILILQKSPQSNQLSVLKELSKLKGYEASFAVLEGLLKKENSLSYYEGLKEKMFEEGFWKEKKSGELLISFSTYVQQVASPEEKYSLFFKGLIKNIDQNVALTNALSFSYEESWKVLKSQQYDAAFTLEFLNIKVGSETVSETAWIYDLAHEFLEASAFKKFDEKVFSTIAPNLYFELWENGKAKIIPAEYLRTYLNSNFEHYTAVKKWIENELVSKENICSFLFENLINQEEIVDKKGFYKYYNHIKCLNELNNDYLAKISALNNPFYNTLLWFYDKSDSLDFQFLKGKFIYFSPEDQVIIVKRLFKLKATGELELSIADLKELSRFDVDLYKLSNELNPEIPIDISTDIIITALGNYIAHNKFATESELISIVLRNLYSDKTRKFKIGNYFESCRGRQTAEYDWSRNGEISKVYYGSKFYYSISFSPGETKWVTNYNWHGGGRDVYTPNPNFEQLKEKVKKITGSRWNAEKSHWGVPCENEEEVLKFAYENKFFLNFDGNHYSNNRHFVKYLRKEIPNGISYCEGRLANKVHVQYNKEFWWCSGGSCFQKCETIHSTNEWASYTLLDFCEILGLNTDETNHMGDFILKGHYYKFIGLINRFKRLLEKLYCVECKEILHPVETGHFAAYNVVNFCCENSNCSEWKKKVYLNHCLNGQCNSIIDSRVSQRCNNGLLICSNCGSCCSHDMLQRRLSNLKLTGGYIHPNLVECVDAKLGHLERAEYFCYKCSDGMIETSTDIFECVKDRVKYDTTKYNLKRPHKGLGKPHNPGGSPL